MRKPITALIAGLLLAPLFASAQTPAPDAAGRGGRAGRGAPTPGNDEMVRPAGAVLKVEMGLDYAQVGGQSLKLDMYHMVPAATPMPVIIWIYGQGGVLARREATPMGALTNNNGYAVVSIDYRNAAGRAEQLADVKSAIRWVRSNAAAYGLDGAHIAVAGYDVGGQLAALAGTTADVPALNGTGGDASVQAVIDIAGPVTTGGLDPSTYVTANDAPTMIFHGTADNKVSTQQSQKLISALKSAGVTSQMNMPFAVGHELGDLLSPIEMQQASAFLSQTLKGERAAGGLSAFVSTPAHTYIDPVALNLAGTKYGLFPTPHGGPTTLSSYRIYLPPGYDANPSKRYPVVYFLHGASVDSKRPLTALYVARADAAIRSGVMPPAIFVIVQGDNAGGYMDSLDGQYMMESILIKDLIPYIDGHYRTIANRANRAIEGHSMGGGGTLHIGFKYPELFATVTGNSPALGGGNVAAGTVDPQAKERPSALAKANTAKLQTQKIRIIIGDKDSLFPGAMALHDELTQLKIPHEWHPVINSPHNHDQLVQYETFDTMAFYGTVWKR